MSNDPTHGVVSAVCGRAADLMVHPAVIVNPAATAADLTGWALVELESLHSFLDRLACATVAGTSDDSEFASQICERLEPVLAGLRAACSLQGDQP